MTRIVLVRHGHVEGIDPPRFRGRMELPLTELGLRQAELTAERIASHWRPVAIYTSPMQRCVQTAGPIDHRRSGRLLDVAFPPLGRAPGGDAARPREVLADPGVVGAAQRLDRLHRGDLAIREHRHAVANRIEGVQVVGDDQNGEIKRLGELADLYAQIFGVAHV